MKRCANYISSTAGARDVSISLGKFALVIASFSVGMVFVLRCVMKCWCHWCWFPQG